MVVVGSGSADGRVWASLFVGEPWVRAGARRADGENRRYTIPWRPVGGGPASGRHETRRDRNRPR
jgi:hypothetical protein